MRYFQPIAVVMGVILSFLTSFLSLMESICSIKKEKEAMADWEGLHNEIFVEIVKKIKLIEDFAAFSLVFKSWSAASNKQYLRRPQIPWLVLPEKKADTKKHWRHIYSVSKESILTRNLYIPEMFGNKRCIGLNYGWVLTTSEKGDMNLVHPLSRSQIELPPQTSIVDYENNERDPPQVFNPQVFIIKAALSGNPSESEDFVVMIIRSGGLYLGYWRKGDESWTRIGRRGRRSIWYDLIYYDDQFYANTYLGEVWSCKVDDDATVVPLVTQLSSSSFSIPVKPAYVVGAAAGVLLLVVRELKIGLQWRHILWWHTNLVSDFQVYELDLMKGSHNQIKSLGDRAIFVGLNTSVLLDHASEYPGIKPNNIYFTPDGIYRGKDMGSYNLEDRKITPFKVEESFSQINTPFWFIPSW